MKGNLDIETSQIPSPILIRAGSTSIFSAGQPSIQRTTMTNVQHPDECIGITATGRLGILSSRLAHSKE